MTDSAVQWQAEGRISFASFVTNLLRTHQDSLGEPSFPFDDVLEDATFWTSARESAAKGTDVVWAANLPRGIGPQTRANCFTRGTITLSSSPILCFS